MQAATPLLLLILLLLVPEATASAPTTFITNATGTAAHTHPAADLPATRARRVAAFVAAFVADAAAMPLHWIYDTDAIASILADAGRADRPEFLPTSHAPFYDYPVGRGTPFGEQMIVYARSLAAKQKVDADAIADAYVEERERESVRERERERETERERQRQRERVRKCV